MKKPTCTHWNGRRRLAKTSKALWKQHIEPNVDDLDRAPLPIRMLQSAFRVYYDLYNNGLCNADVLHIKHHFYTLIVQHRFYDEHLPGRETDKADRRVRMVKEYDRHAACGDMYISDESPFWADMETVMDAVTKAVMRELPVTV